MTGRAGAAILRTLLMIIENSVISKGTGLYQDAISQPRRNLGEEPIGRQGTPGAENTTLPKGAEVSLTGRHKPTQG